MRIRKHIVVTSINQFQSIKNDGGEKEVRNVKKKFQFVVPTRDRHQMLRKSV